MKTFHFLLLVLCISACRSDGTTSNSTTSSQARYQKVSGETMGTTYNITFNGDTPIKQRVDSLLVAVNADVNTYEPNSTISNFNKAKVGVDLSEKRHQHFLTNYKAAIAIAKNTNSAFDPTVMPLVNYWGFGYTPKKPVTAVDSLKIDSLLQAVGIDKLTYKNTILQKSNEKLQLDFGAIAKGYGVDEIGRMLEADSILNYMVEIGGEVRARGVNPKGQAWTVGVNQPQEGAAVSEMLASLALDNVSVATSGNYRNFYEVDGVKYSHTINPKTGFPERNRMLSASIVATDCMIADAYATACMVLDVEKAKALVARTDGLEAHFIYSTPDGGMETFTTEALKSKIKDMSM